MSILWQGGPRKRVQCLQPAFTLNYIKWSLLAGPGRTVGAVIVSSLAAGDLLQALPAHSWLPALSTYTIIVFLQGKRAGQHTGAQGAEQDRDPKVLVWKLESLKLSGCVALTSPGLGCACSLWLSHSRECPHWMQPLGISQESPVSLWGMELYSCAFSSEPNLTTKRAGEFPSLLLANGKCWETSRIIGRPDCLYHWSTAQLSCKSLTLQIKPKCHHFQYKTKRKMFYVCSQLI